MKRNAFIYLLLTIIPSIIILFSFSSNDPEIPISSESQDCIFCHKEIHPGLVADWEKSLHARQTPAEAEKKSDLKKRMSSFTANEAFKNVAVGCYECHSLNTSEHTDAFEHNGYTITVVVSPNDCAECHATEAEEYKDNIMSHAYANLMDNSLYSDLRLTINGQYEFKDKKLQITHADRLTTEESCLYCHGTKVETEGTETRSTMFGDMDFPKLKGWPNQGVGRINPDGSKGSCAACHTRHEFSIATARKPHTCAECHKGPDVPAYKVYLASKHGNLYESKSSDMNFTNVPWTVGKDFTVPTCATCHVSLITDENEQIIAERTHAFNDRLSWRLFGVPYAHPHPIDGDVSKIKNSDGLPIPVELNSEPVSEFLISPEEQESRTARMKKVCTACHSTSWSDGHFARLDNTIKNTNALTLTATNILSEAWKKGYAEGLPQGANIFDESIERDWVKIWLFHANSTRFASAMGGGGDYGVFADGRFQLSELIQKMYEWIELQEQLESKKNK
jgi:hydroxylamine dehydrogenase